MDASPTPVSFAILRPLSRRANLERGDPTFSPCARGRRADSDRLANLHSRRVPAADTPAPGGPVRLRYGAGRAYRPLPSALPACELLKIKMPSGGNVTFSEYSRPCQETGVATARPRFPCPLPP